jgi:hypothetical protein
MDDTVRYHLNVQVAVLFCAVLDMTPLKAVKWRLALPRGILAYVPHVTEVDLFSCQRVCR